MTTNDPYWLRDGYWGPVPDIHERVAILERCVYTLPHRLPTLPPFCPNCDLTISHTHATMK